MKRTKVKMKIPYIKQRDLRYKNGIKCKSKRVPSQTAGNAKAGHCQKKEDAILCCSSRVVKNLPPDQIQQMYDYWNGLNRTKSLR